MATKKKLPHEKLRQGVPSTYTEEIADKICHLVSTHTCGWDTLMQMYDLPYATTIRTWRLKHPSFNTKYLEAKKTQAELLVEEIDELLPTNLKTYLDERGNERYDSSSASMMIAKINNRKWTAARLSPKIWGEQKQIENLETQNESLRAELRELRAEMDKKNKKDY